MRRSTTPVVRAVSMLRTDHPAVDRRRSALLLALAVLFLAPGFSRAETIDYATLFHWSTRTAFGQEAVAVATRGEIACVLLENRLEILDAGGPHAPRPLGQLGLPGTPADIAVREGLAYVAAQAAGLLVIDITDPANPTQVGSLPGLSQANRVVLDGERAYVQDGMVGQSDKIRIVDISVPTSPALLATFQPGGWGVCRFTARDDLVILTDADWGRFRVFDLSVPTSPQFLSTREVNLHAGAVTLDGATLYIGFSNDSWPPEAFGGIARYDLTDPAAPVALGEVVFGYELPVEILVRDGVAYTQCLSAYSAGGEVYAVAVPESAPMELLRGVRLSVSVGMDIALREDGICVAGAGESGTGTLEVFRGADFSDQVLGEMSFYGEGSWDIDAAAGFLYLPDNAPGVRVVDVADPHAPTTLGIAPLEDSPRSVAVSAATIFASTLAHLHGGTIPSPGAISWCSATPAGAPMGHLTLHGDHLYLARGYTDLLILDVADPCNPVLLATLPLGAGIRDLAARDDHVCAAVGPVLTVIDVSEPSHPHVVGSLAASGTPYAQCLAVSGPLALLGLWGGDLWIVDIADPTQPVSLARLPMPSSSFGIQVDGDFAYVACNYGHGLYIVDISDPARPFIAGGFWLGLRPGSHSAGETRVTLASGCAALLDLSQGMFLLPRHAGAAAAGDPAPYAAGTRLRLLGPNPARDRVALRLDSPGAIPARLIVTDAGGRIVRHLPLAALPAGTTDLVWDGIDAAGRRVPSGLYFVHLDAGARCERVRTVILR